MHNQELDVLGINETRLDSDVPIDFISVGGYTWIATNRNRSGGGVGFYVRNSINFEVRQDLNNNEIESLTIEILKPKIKPFPITTWYRQPNSSIDKLKEFEKLLQDIDHEDKESIKLGDINIDISKDSFDTNSAELKFITDLFEYDQKINEPTRVTNATRTLIQIKLTL